MVTSISNIERFPKRLNESRNTKHHLQYQNKNVSTQINTEEKQTNSIHRTIETSNEQVDTKPWSFKNSKTFHRRQSKYPPPSNKSLSINESYVINDEKLMKERDKISKTPRAVNDGRPTEPRLSMNTDEAATLRTNRSSIPHASSSSYTKIGELFPSTILPRDITSHLPRLRSYQLYSNQSISLLPNVNGPLKTPYKKYKLYESEPAIISTKTKEGDQSLSYDSLPLVLSSLQRRSSGIVNNERDIVGNIKMKPKSQYIKDKYLGPKYILTNSMIRAQTVSKRLAFKEQISSGIKHGNASMTLKEKSIPYQEPLRRSNRMKRKADMLEVSVMEGGDAELPCDHKVNNRKDSVQLILWIKEGVHTPLYSYDYRELLGGRPKEMKPDVNSTMAQRTSFRTGAPSALRIEKVEAEDAGIYRCRADFSLSPTINRRINLTVIVPPRRVQISWRIGKDSNTKHIEQEKNIVGPFFENGRPTLICSNEDGWPPASLSWYENGNLLDDSWAVHLDKGIVENEITLEPLTRSDLGRKLTCVARNNNNSEPASRTVIVEMTLSILDAKVDELGRIWAGVKTEVECAVWGSRPPPAIVWWLGPNVKLAQGTQTMENGNMSISQLSFIPTPKEDGVMLICQATNDHLVDQAVQDSRLLTVNYAPVVKIQLGPSLNPERIKEGDDVYFECSVKAKPPAFKVIWKQNGVELSGGQGVFVANMSLVVQKVNRSHAGYYSCEATNIRNTTTAKPIFLDVKYSPVCVEVEKHTFAVARRENALVACKVEANPSNVSFSWSFNNSAEAISIPNDRFVVVGNESRVSYTPVDEMDYGTLQCRANNSIGTQSVPCFYKIIPAGKPDPPHNCRVSEVTISSLMVNCLPGDDGGLNQTFKLQVYKIGSDKTLLMEMGKEAPNFSIPNLRPATPYRIVITAVNSIGPSRVIELKTYTAKVPESQQETNAEPARDREREPGLPLVVLVGGGVVLVPLLVVIVVLIRVKLCRSIDTSQSSPNEGRRSSSHSAEAPSTDLASDASGHVDECDPDILSHTQGMTDLPPHWIDEAGNITTLQGSLYKLPEGIGGGCGKGGGGTIISTSVGPHFTSPHTILHTSAIAAPQVPYYTDVIPGQHTGNVAIISASFAQPNQQQQQPHQLQNQQQQQLLQQHQEPNPVIDMNVCYPPAPFDMSSNPYTPFSHICQSNIGCTSGPSPNDSTIQYNLTQFQPENMAVINPPDMCPPPPPAPAVTCSLQRRGSKRTDSQRAYSTPLSASQVPVSLVKNELSPQPQRPCKGSSGKGGADSDKISGTLKRKKEKTDSISVTTGSGQSDNNKVESSV